MKVLNLMTRGGFNGLLAFFSILLVSSHVAGQIRHVPEEYPSIQAAIAASTSGDTVLVNDGFYQEQVNFSGKNIVVTSRYILDFDSAHIYNTEINRSFLNEGVLFINGESPAAQLIGFTVSNCLWKAVSCNNSSPRIRHNIIKGNHATGVYLYNSEATISDNEIHCAPGFTRGGPYEAIHLFNSGPVIERNRINGNDPAGNVHAIYFDLWNYVLPDVQTHIRENLITGPIFGALPDNGLPQFIHHNIFVSGNGYSSAMNITECASNLKIFNNTVIGGSGIWIQGGNLPDIRNNIVAYANIGIELWVDTATIAYNNIWDCKISYSGIPDQTNINGNISADPGFIDSANLDFHILCWSKCIDAGDSLSDYSREPEPNGGRINMGRYGNTYEAVRSEPCIRAFPELIDFMYVPVGETRDSTVLIVNAGYAQLIITDVNTSLPDNFTTDYPGGSTFLNRDDSLVLMITFHPLEDTIHYWDSLQISSNSASSGTVYLTGHTAMVVNEINVNKGIRLYPVPVVGDYLFLEPVMPWSQDVTVEIIGISGEVLSTERIHPIDKLPVGIYVGNLKEGIYCLRIRQESESLTRKFSICSP